MADANYSVASSATFNYNSLDQSAKYAYKNKILLDNLSRIYNYDNIIEFPISFLKKYENILKASLVDFELPKEQYYRPEYVSYEVFDTTDLWYLILFVNEMQHPMELCKPLIKVPNSYAIIELLYNLKEHEKMVEKSHDEPIPVKRILIKDVNFSSDDIIKTDKTRIKSKNIDFNTDNNIAESEDFLNKNVYLEEISFYSNTSFIDNKNYDFDTCNRFGIPFDRDNKNTIISLPDKHKLCKNGYYTDKTIHTNFYLEMDKKYALVKRYNGKSEIMINGIKDENYNDILTKSLTRNPINHFDTSIMKYDIREASLNNENNLYSEEDQNYDGVWVFNKNQIIKNNPNIKFDNDLGKYYFYKEFSTKDSLDEQSVKFIMNINNDLKLNDINLKDYSFLGINLLYSAYYNGTENDNIQFSPLNIKVYYEENNEEKFYKYSYPLENNTFNTNYSTEENQLSNIKRIFPIIEEKDNHLNITKIELEFRYDFKGQDNMTFYLELSEIQFYGYKYDDIVEEFTMSTASNTYDISYDYDYDSFLNGFYYEPYIINANDNFSELLSDDYNNDAKTIKNFSISTRLLHKDEYYLNNNYQFNKSLFNSNYFSNIYIDNFSLEDDYSLEFKLNSENKVLINGSVGILIESMDRTTGYLMTFSSLFNDSDKDKQIYNSNGHCIIENGFYKLIRSGKNHSYIIDKLDALDLRYSKNIIDEKNIFKNKNENNNTIIPKFVRFTRIGNRISIFYKLEESLNDYELYCTFNDFTNVFKNGSIRFLNFFNNEISFSIDKIYYLNKNIK